MAIQSLYPSSRPTLNLNFAKVKALDPRITFVRTITATYYGTETAKAEENLLLQSEDFTNAVWDISSSITRTANTTTAPDGTSTADTITAVAGTSLIPRAVQAYATSSQVTSSVFAKKGTHDYIQLLTNAAGSGFVNFDLDAGTLSATTATGTITDVGNGWYRCTATFVAQIIANVQYGLAASASAVRNETWNPAGTETVYLWGAQLEQRSAVTAYTPTTTQPITNYIPVLETAASGVARFDHNPTTGESLGLLVEEQRTNLFERSQEFDNAAWTKIRSSIVSNTIVAPDGTLTGDKLVENTDTNTHSTRQDFTISVGTYTYTIFAKAAERQVFQVVRSNTNIDLITHIFNLSTGIATGTGASMTSVGNGWYRCVGVITVNTAASTGVNLTLSDGSSITYTGNGYSGIYIWGAQLEAGAFPTSYIATTSATVTRNADAATMTGTNFSSWFNNAEGTLYAAFMAPHTIPPSAPIIFVFNDGTFSNSILMSTNGFFNCRVGVRLNAINQADYNAGTFVTANNEARWTLAYKTNDMSASANGNAAVTDTSVLIPVVNQASIGSRPGGGFATGYVKKLAFYPARLPDAELQQLTK